MQTYHLYIVTTAELLNTVAGVIKARSKYFNRAVVEILSDRTVIINTLEHSAEYQSNHKTVLYMLYKTCTYAWLSDIG